MPDKRGNLGDYEAVERALALDPNVAEVQAHMGRIKIFVNLDSVGADVSFQRGVNEAVFGRKLVADAQVSIGDLADEDRFVPRLLLQHLFHSQLSHVEEPQQLVEAKALKLSAVNAAKGFK